MYKNDRGNQRLQVTGIDGVGGLVLLQRPRHIVLLFGNRTEAEVNARGVLAATSPLPARSTSER